MREIKFRCFENGKFYYSDSQEDAQELGAKLGSSLIATFFNRFHGHENLSQFTGLKDKNGECVYEGDIISCHLEVLRVNLKAVVKYQDTYFTAIVAEMQEDLPLYGLTNINVIGNIHEKSGLLK